MTPRAGPVNMTARFLLCPRLRGDASMARARCFWLLALLAGAAGTPGAEPTVPPLPRDTLPAKLALDAIPLGLGRGAALPDDNPLTEAKVQLGRKLFFDPILSADGTLSCASCHRPEHGLASPEPKAVGIRGQRGRRNAPSLFNRAYAV